MASAPIDFAQGAPNEASLLANSANQPQNVQQYEDFDADATQMGSSHAAESDLRGGTSTMSQSQTLTPSRGGTLKKRQSLSKKASLKRKDSGKRSRAASVRGSADRERLPDQVEFNNVFFTPVPTTGNPTEILADRFQAWRKVLKDLITYFRDIQKSYEARSKSVYTLSNVINNIAAPPVFLNEGGIADATHILRDYHKQSISEGNKAKTIEEDVIVQLTGLRSDLQQKIKEIKSLSGDFKNNVDKETEGTRRSVRDLQEALGVAESDPHASSGKGDPFIVKLGVDRQVERQIEEENYLHRAFLNLESSGRELESIVVGEIQKAYNAYAGIIGREADEAYEAVEKLRVGPIAMAKDREWDAFVDKNEHFVDPKLPVRRMQNITYPGKDDPAASEVKAGMLERKSKYLKSYTPGYVLSPTHLHEFKSPDHIASQAPVMSLFLPDQKLGSHSGPESSSHKFMLKGRQSGGIHRGHSWVFRAESYETMMAWFEDIKNLTEKTGAERKAFIRQHARSVSAGSQKAGSISSEGAMEEDEADEVPFSATASQVEPFSSQQDKRMERPNPGGRFPSALKINRDSQVPISPSSPSPSTSERDLTAAAALPGSGVPFGDSGKQVQTGDEANEQRELGGAGSQPSNYYASQPIGHLRDHDAEQAPMQDDTTFVGKQREHTDFPVQHTPKPRTDPAAEYSNMPAQAQGVSSDGPSVASHRIPREQQPTAVPRNLTRQIERHDSQYGDWMAPVAAGLGGATVGAAGVEAYHNRHQDDKKPEREAAETSPTEQEPIVYPSTSSTHPLPNNVAWAEVPNSAPVLPVVDPTSPDDPFGSRRPSISQQMPLGSIGIYIDSTTEARSPAEPLLRRVTEEPRTPGVSVNDPAAPIKDLADRPSLHSHTSTLTISDLHIPGEYPKPQAR